MYFVYKDSNFL